MTGPEYDFDGTMWDPAIAQTFDRVLGFLKKQLE
jgi:hypothetical protein